MIDCAPNIKYVKAVIVLHTYSVLRIVYVPTSPKWERSAVGKKRGPKMEIWLKRNESSQLSQEGCPSLPWLQPHMLSGVEELNSLWELIQSWHCSIKVMASVAAVWFGTDANRFWTRTEPLVRFKCGSVRHLGLMVQFRFSRCSEILNQFWTGLNQTEPMLVGWWNSTNLNYFVYILLISNSEMYYNG